MQPHGDDQFEMSVPFCWTHEHNQACERHQCLRHAPNPGGCAPEVSGATLDRTVEVPTLHMCQELS